MNSIRQVEQWNKAELENCTPPEASWHRDHKNSAFIHIGGLNDRLTEGDIIAIFSQYGEPVFLNLVRDKETGKSRGFAFLKYEDQRSCDLAVDNLSGAKVMDRLLSVNHTVYKKRDDEDMSDNTRAFAPLPDDSRKSPGREMDDETEKEDEGSESEPDRPLLKEEVELQKLLIMDDEDPMKSSLVQSKREEVDAARQKIKSKRRHKSDKKDRQHSYRKSKSSHREDRDSRRTRHPSRSPRHRHRHDRAERE